MDQFLPDPLPKAIKKREDFARQLLEVDARVSEIVKQLREKGLESPYLRNFVVARLNPIRFQRGKSLPIGETLAKMREAAEKFKTDKISVSDLARTGTGGSPGEESQ